MKLGHVGKTIRLAILGLGGRGIGEMKCLLDMEDVQITAVCDVYPDRIENARKIVEEKKGNIPFGSANATECIRRDDVDAVLVMTSWEYHIPLCIESMRAGKRVAMEVGGATDVDKCWQLVRVSEETGVPCMLLENCCYGETELTLLNMIRKGVFGTVVHCAGAYSHDLRSEIGSGDINRYYLQRFFLHRNAELYPTHELGPICNYLNINRGNRMVSLTSMASKSCGLHEWLVRNRPDSHLVNTRIKQGDIVTTMIKCANGETIVLTFDCTLPRAYSRGGVVRGTNAMWMEDGRTIYMDGWDHKAQNDAAYMEEYEHPLWKEYRKLGIRGGHDGMDYLALRAFVESVQNETEPPIDVYDAAAWMSITALSEESIAKGSMPVAIPDFTSGRWCQRETNPHREEFNI